MILPSKQVVSSHITRMWGCFLTFSTVILFAVMSWQAGANSFSGSDSSLINPASKSDAAVCKFSIVLPAWRTEAIRRGLACDDDGNLLSPSVSRPAAAPKPPALAQPDIETPSPSPESTTPATLAQDDAATQNPAPEQAAPQTDIAATPAVQTDSPVTVLARQLDNKALCRMATDGSGDWHRGTRFSAFVIEAENRGLTCGPDANGPNDSGPAMAVATGNSSAPAPDLVEADTDTKPAAGTQIAATPPPAKPPVKPAAKTIVTTVAKNTIPDITILNASSTGPQGTISGRVTDGAGIAELRVEGRLVQVAGNGNFTAKTYVPQGGITVRIEAVNMLGTATGIDVRLDRLAAANATPIAFDRLNPLGRAAIGNEDALALIIGVETYTETPVKAAYANSDARVFADYAVQKLGIPADRIKTLVDDVADEKGILLTVQDWLYRANRPGKSDIYVFFAGHGLASEDGNDMYLLPYDGSPRLLDRTALLRKELFADIAEANPRSVTVFLDTCYSGTTRGTETLIASRPIAIRAKEQAVPKGFTVMTAAGGDQTAKPLEEVKHGMFSYFLMKGMEGDADANQDKLITAGELHAYVQQNVAQQSSGSQTPELQGDANRVLVRFQ